MNPEWEYKSIEKLPIKIGDGNYSSKYPKADEFVKTGIPFISASDLKYGRIISDNFRFICEEQHKVLLKGHLKFGDILIVTRGNGTGAVGWVESQYENCNINAQLALLRTDEKTIHNKFLYYLLSSYEYQELLRSFSSGSAQPQLPLKSLIKLKLSFPPYLYQVKIAEILSCLDNQIILLRETNTTLESIAQALFKSWFIDFDPVQAKAEGREPEGMDAGTAALFPDGFEESELGAIPSGWRVGKLSDLANLNPESWSRKNHPDKILYIDLANAKENIINEIAEYRIDNAPSRAKRVLRDGDTIVGTVRPGNRSFALIKNASPNLTGSTGFAVLRPSVVENTEFLYLATTTDLNIEYLTHIADGGAYPAVRPEVVINLKTIIPSLKIIKTYHSIVKPVLSRVSENQQQIQSLTNIRDTLLPKLISGQLCLNNEVLVS